MTNLSRVLFLFISCVVISSTSFAASFEWNDPTDSKPFLPWVWEDQLKPTAEKSWDLTGASILLAGAVGTAAAHTQDDRVFEYTQNHDLMSDSWEQVGGFLASGGPGVFLALTQLWWDQPAGLQNFRAMMWTTATHVTLAASINRERPPGQNRGWSFPSGHTSNAFAIATSLAYSYGPWVGVPSYGLATFIAASRISAQVHWLSDVVAAAAIGIYWGRASALVTDSKKPATTFIYPVPIDGGALVNFSKVF